MVYNRLIAIGDAKLRRSSPAPLEITGGNQAGVEKTHLVEYLPADKEIGSGTKAHLRIELLIEGEDRVIQLVERGVLPCCKLNPPRKDTCPRVLKAAQAHFEPPLIGNAVAICEGNDPSAACRDTLVSCSIGTSDVDLMHQEDRIPLGHIRCSIARSIVDNYHFILSTRQGLVEERIKQRSQRVLTIVSGNYHRDLFPISLAS